jgi:hypothetical protein
VLVLKTDPKRFLLKNYPYEELEREALSFEYSDKVSEWSKEISSFVEESSSVLPDVSEYFKKLYKVWV